MYSSIYFQVEKFFSNVVNSLTQKKMLPPLWNAQVGDGGIHLLKFSVGEARVVQRSVFLTSERKLKIFVHGRELSEKHNFL